MSLPSYPELILRVLVARWRLARQGFSATAEQLLREPGLHPWAEGPRTVQRLRRVAKLLPGSTCLHRAIGLIAAAQARGLDPRLVLGVQRHGGHGRAHAWVEMAGQCLGERQLEGRHFHPLPAPELKS